MSGHGAPDQQPVDCSDLRVAVVAASWHTQVMDGLLARRPASARATTRSSTPGGAGARHVRAACGRGCSGGQGVRRRGRPGCGDPRRHAALRLRLQRRHRRADPGGARPPGRGGFRRPHLRHRRAGDRPGRPGRVEGGQGLRGHLGRPADRRVPWPRSASDHGRSGVCDGRCTTGSTATQVAFSAALPDSTSTRAPSVRMLVLTPPSGPPQPCGMLTTPGRISSLSSAGSSMTPTLERTETC